jgi:hypothetical protein
MQVLDYISDRCLSRAGLTTEWLTRRKNKVKKGSTYGELTRAGLMKILQLQPAKCQGFVDLGSGYGNLLWHVAHLCPGWDVIGIECEEDLIEKGERFQQYSNEDCSRWGIPPTRYVNLHADVMEAGWEIKAKIGRGAWLVWENSKVWENGESKKHSLV